MATTTMFQLADQILDGQLEALLRSWQRAGVSRRAAAKLLSEALGGIDIDPLTITRWTKSLDEHVA